MLYKIANPAIMSSIKHLQFSKGYVRSKIYGWGEVTFQTFVFNKNKESYEYKFIVIKTRDLMMLSLCEWI